MLGRLISLAITLAGIYVIWNFIDPDSLHRFTANILDAIHKTFG